MSENIISFTSGPQRIEAVLAASRLGGTLTAGWTGTPDVTHHRDPVALPRTWVLDVSVQSPDNGVKFSPPPFTLIVDGTGQRTALVVAADAGWHRWNQVVFEAGPDQVRVSIDLEGHTEPRAAAAHTRLHLVKAEPGESRSALLARALRQAYVTKASTVHDWWLRPIYCGWGDQVAAAMATEGVGPEGRAPRYCTQARYEHWLDRLDEAEVPIGTVIIDDGWSTAGSWQTHRERWPDLPGFIARQHERGRHVLLWLALWLCEGLPDDWCLHVGDQKLTADPTHQDYRQFVRQQVAELLCSAGCDADGFKIDQLGYVPSERDPRGGERTFQSRVFAPAQQPITLQEDLWGCELLHDYQKLIYDAAKAAKPDALITSSTVHPYFADSLDMVRLHDMGGVPADIFAAMQARADLARAALPGKPIDADNWVHSDYEMWQRYTAGSTAIGVPSILYAHRFMLNWRKEPATKMIPLEDLRRIGAAWRQTMPAWEPAPVAGAAC